MNDEHLVKTSQLFGKKKSADIHLVIFIDEFGKTLLIKNKENNTLLLPSIKLVSKNGKKEMKTLGITIPKNALKAIAQIGKKKVFVYIKHITSEQLGLEPRHVWVKLEDVKKGKTTYPLPFYNEPFKLSKFLLKQISNATTDTQTVTLFK